MTTNGETKPEHHCALSPCGRLLWSACMTCGKTAACPGCADCRCVCSEPELHLRLAKMSGKDRIDPALCYRPDAPPPVETKCGNCGRQFDDKTDAIYHLKCDPAPLPIERAERMTEADVNLSLASVHGQPRLVEEIRRARAAEDMLTAKYAAMDVGWSEVLSTLRADNARLTAERNALTEKVRLLHVEAYEALDVCRKANDLAGQANQRALAAEQERDQWQKTALESARALGRSGECLLAVERERDAEQRRADSRLEALTEEQSRRRALDDELRKARERASYLSARLQSVTAALEKIRDCNRPSACPNCARIATAALSAPSPTTETEGGQKA